MPPPALEKATPLVPPPEATAASAKPKADPATATEASDAVPGVALDAPASTDAPTPSMSILSHTGDVDDNSAAAPAQSGVKMAGAQQLLPSGGIQVEKASATSDEDVSVPSTSFRPPESTNEVAACQTPAPPVGAVREQEVGEPW